MTGWIITGISIVAGAYGVFIYNKLVRSRQMVGEGFSGIDVQLKRRADLIPALVEAVRGYMGHEKSTIEKVTALRAQAQSASSNEERLRAEAGITKALGGIMLIAENYPALMASENFLNLQTQLSEIEDHLQMARRYYNGAVRNLNIMIEQFPSNVVASIFRFAKSPFFELESESDRNRPDIKINP